MALGWTLSSVSLSMLRSPELDPGLQMQLHQCCIGGRVTFLELPAKCCPVEPKLPLAYFGTGVHWCFALSLLFTRTPQVLFFQAAFQLSDSWYILVYGRLFHPRCGTSHFSWYFFQKEDTLFQDNFRKQW